MKATGAGRLVGSNSGQEKYGSANAGFLPTILSTLVVYKLAFSIWEEATTPSDGRLWWCGGGGYLGGERFVCLAGAVEKTADWLARRLFGGALY